MENSDKYDSLKLEIESLAAAEAEARCHILLVWFFSFFSTLRLFLKNLLTNVLMNLLLCFLFYLLHYLAYLSAASFLYIKSWALRQLRQISAVNFTKTCFTVGLLATLSCDKTNVVSVMYDTEIYYVSCLKRWNSARTSFRHFIFET